jgi:regulator of RNase E activity RraB
MSPDANTLKALLDAGSNLAKPHVIDHWFYFRDEPSARAAGQELTAAGFSVEDIAKESEGADWRVLARKTMVPLLADVEKTSAYLEVLAKRHHGDYDGWETQVEE